jgi:hypothetical protein
MVRDSRSRVAFGAGSGGFKPSRPRTAAISGSNFRTRSQPGPDPVWLRFSPQKPPLGLARPS